MLFRKKQSSSTSTIPRIGGLPASRKGALLLALLCAGAAAIILVVAVGQYQQSATPTTVQDTVLVATHVIQKGTSGDTIAQQQLYESTPVSVKSIAPGALTNAAALQGVYAVNTILPGQQLTAADFQGQGGPVTQLAPDQRAITVTFDGQHGNIGVIAPGDHVDVYGSFNYAGFGNLGQGPVKGAATSGGSSVPIVRLLVANALVLKAPAATTAIGGSNGTNGNVTLAIPEVQAPDVAFAADWGKVWLTLRPANATPTSQAATDVATDVLGVRIIINVVNGKLVFTGIPGLVPNSAQPGVTGRQWAATASAKGKK
jgi:Flp pilus assembly protein CpaB